MGWLVALKPQRLFQLVPVGLRPSLQHGHLANPRQQSEKDERQHAWQRMANPARLARIGNVGKNLGQRLQATRKHSEPPGNAAPHEACAPLTTRPVRSPAELVRAIRLRSPPGVDGRQVASSGARRYAVLRHKPSPKSARGSKESTV